MVRLKVPKTSRCQPLRQRLASGEVDQLHFAIGFHQEIVGLDVAVNPALAVEVGQSFGGLDDASASQREELIEVAVDDLLQFCD